MKFFKKALVASAILGASTVANAADLTDATVAHSAQGIEVNGATASTIRVIVREQLEAGDLITFTFGTGVDKTGLAALAVDTLPAADVAKIDVNYGSGTYTVSEHASTDLSKGILVLEVNTGDPVTKDSSFELYLPASAFDATKASTATATYSAKSGLTGDAKDTSGDNTGLFLVTQDQYAVSVKSDFDGVVERLNQVTFTKNGDLFANGSNSASLDDAVLIDVTDNQTLASKVTAATTTLTVDVTGNFKDYAANMATAEAFLLSTAATPIALAGTTATVAKVNDTTARVVVSADNFAGNVLGDFYLALTKPVAAGKTIPATEFLMDSSVGFGGAKAFVTQTDADAGEWKLDATVITVPYFPVGKEGTSSSIHFANNSSSDVDVIVSVIDADGTDTYTSMDLGKDLGKNAVTKVSQAELIALFGLPTDSLTKLSVTFNIDAKEGDVNAYAFTTDDTGRTEISTTQQHGQ
ncbi:hypothetical protein [Thalassotalea atypica]|uniref:hypothetical protein n=1 Tax=Thalassotalea atypica TaxID=2054316 RepID=UPI002573212B|nr:hypothetical protein [Thalassotalea atypica]